MRTIYGLPIRSLTTGFFHQRKISLREFVEEVKSSIVAYEEVVIRLGNDPDEEKYYPETWATSFLAFMEIEPENNDELRKS